MTERELVGIIGPNGAGKTTLIKMLCGIIQPTSGEVSVLGYRPGDLQDGFRRRYAVVMGQKSQLWWDLPALDTFRLNQKIYSIPQERFEQNLKEYTALFGVEALLHAPVRNLSLGERMKMELMAALLHDPELLFLDEPTIGLDAIAQKSIRQFLKEVNARRQVTILLTSHYMADIRHLCHRTLVVNDGRKVYDGPLEALLTRFQNSRDIQVTLPEKIRSGKLDLYLTKPIAPLFHITFESIDVGSGFLALPGIAMVVWATVQMKIPLTFGRVAGYLLLLVLMLVLLYDLVLIMRAVAFWVVQVNALEELEGELMGFAFRVPGIVFQGMFRLLFCVFLPYALLATIPTQFFTDRLAPGAWISTLLVTAGFTLLARWVWKAGLKRYDSTGN